MCDCAVPKRLIGTEIIIIQQDSISRVDIVQPRKRSFVKVREKSERSLLSASPPAGNLKFAIVYLAFTAQTSVLFRSYGRVAHAGAEFVKNRGMS